VSLPTELNPTELNRTTSFLSGGGEMGARMRAFDWKSTPLGPPQAWPQSLKTAVRIMLTSRQPIWIGWGDELTYLYNDAYKSIIGGKHPVALGQPTAVVWREIWHIIGPMLKAATTGDEGTYVEEQLLIMERNGYPEETYYTYSYTPIPNDEGGTGGIICANTDDTQRVIGERQLTLLRELAATTADTRTWQEVCTRAARALETNLRDLPFAILYMSEPGENTLSLVASSGIEPGHPAAPLSMSLDDTNPTWPFREVIAEHTPEIVDDLSKFSALPTGSWPRSPFKAVVLPLNSSAETARSGILVAGVNPFRLLDDGYLGFLSLAAGQISASIAVADAYEQEKRRAEALAELDRAKTTFFSNVSHEFRTPLTLMLGPTEDALEGTLEESQRERLETVHRNAKRLQKLVNTLLDFSRIEAGRIKATFAPTDISALVSELASVFRSAVERAGMTLDIRCSPTAGEPVYVDHDLFEKIVLNLISNAFKYTLNGGITVKVNDAKEHVEIVVSDTGIGIAESELPRLFDRFHRVEGAQGRTHEGSGIGLALVYELAKLHHGEVSVTSTVGKGSTFTVKLPKGSAHFAPQQVASAPLADGRIGAASTYVEEALRWLPNSGESAGDPEAQADTTEDSAGDARPSLLHRDRILLADDNADMREYVRKLLGSRFKVEAVTNGADALKSASTHRPDLIVTDVMMPVMDGFELLRNIKADAALRDVPVLMLSARAGEESRLEGLHAGADDYIVKPFSGRELHARISAQLELSRVRREGQERERSLRQEAEALNELALTIGADLDLTSLVQKVTDAGRNLTQAAFGAFFYNVIDHKGESYVLYTLSGAPREAFEKFGMPHATKLFGPTFRGEGVIRIADVLQDPRYAQNPPHKGMPPGHLPVRSYLAAPVTSRTGEVLGGLFFGHPEPGIFTERAERIAAGLASQAAVAIDNARLYGQSQREVAERKQAEESVLRRETQLRALFDQAPMGIFLVDADLVFRHVNPLAVPALGSVATEPKVGTSLRDRLASVLPKEEAQSIIDRYLHTLATGEPFRAPEYPNTYYDPGRTSYFDWQIHRLPLPDGTSGVVCYFTDISEHVRSRQALAESEDRLRSILESERAARGEAERAGRMKDEFLATLSHELRTPLNAIIGWTHLLRKAPPTQAQMEQGLVVIDRNARMQAQLISDLLDMSRIISGKMRLDVQRVELPVVIEAALEAVRPAADAREVRLQSVLEPINDIVHGDPARLQQIVWNLLSNAVKFTGKGGRVQIVLARVNSHVEITISDTGKGIKPEFLPYVFERFRQADNSASREHGGLGLGLSIVKQLVEMHGGTVHAASGGDNKGATFSIHLPLAVVHQPEHPMARVHPKAVTLTPQTNDQPDLAGVHVLVVDDEADAREIVKRVLEDCGASVDVAASAAEGRAKLAARKPDVIISDIGMPGEDGYSFIKSVRQSGSRFPAAALTAFARSEDRTKALLSGYQSHISKPVEPSELLATVAVLAQRR
jgi:signal transduction histidine kinase/DNA-binding response OmpR family regulator